MTINLTENKEVNGQMANEGSRNYTSLWADLHRTSFSQGYLDVAGIQTRYMMAGDQRKPLLLLLHGTGGHAEAYTRNLGPHSEHFWTVAIDMVGHGWTDKPDVAYEIKDYVEHVLNVIKTLGREKALISGESLGGWVSAYIGVHHPEVVEKLVLNTAGGWTAHPEVMTRIKTLSMQAVNDPSWERIQARLEFLMYDNSMVCDDLIETRRAIYSQPGFAASMERIMCLQEMETRRQNMISEAQYQSISAPTLVVWTSHDPTASPEEGKQIADMIPNARYVVMNKCGHWPQYENADEFNRIHMDFLLEN
ncbi:MAG: alpha/beta hydrolase [Kordiimonadaceae bacterium]|nr:alpha/beta hydrolase [Kordiimonadaceae bacterium]